MAIIGFTIVALPYYLIQTRRAKMGAMAIARAVLMLFLPLAGAIPGAMIGLLALRLARA